MAEVAAGSDEERGLSLDSQVDAFLLSLADEQGFGPSQLAAACDRAILRHQKIVDALIQAARILRLGSKR